MASLIYLVTKFNALLRKGFSDMNKFIDIHTHKIKKANYLISVYNHFLQDELPKVDSLFSVGLHPWHISKLDLTILDKSLENLIHKKAPAFIGEIGIDRNIDIPLEVQTEYFLKQAIIAEQFNLPVIIHSVRTVYDIIKIKKEHKFQQPWILHSFNGNIQMIDEALKYNFYFSFGSNLFRNNFNDKQLKSIPLEYTFLETDDADYSIIDVFARFCALRNIDLESLKKTVYNNFTRINNF